ncbi:hypothetical protein M0D69_13845 [Caballeronia sp. SEWSISQ10-4 2]|uniref:hypothetical protein n=1 Tax=Caballeronia sp. SEWSISQ10-4 2 TaxID=2937438 RepID=UPI0026568D5C|nr:hypothetical protein [Caballeronia sp. SEWSISQ10-4 2]MDN7179076.1 hypothetical protein [Caballeronia sp. SEWSISQ10-4 2]
MTTTDPLAPDAPAETVAKAASTRMAGPKSTIVDMATGEVVEPKTDIAALKPEERALVVLKSTQTEIDLKALIERTKAIVTAPKDKAGREEVHRAAMDHKNARLAITNGAKAATEDAKQFTKAVSAEEKRLIALNTEEEARLFKLRDDYDEAEKLRVAEEERVEKLRVDAIKERIEQIAALHLQSIDDTAADLAATIDDLTGFEVTFEDFAEFQDEAKAVITTAIAALSGLHASAAAREAAAEATKRAEEALAAQKEAFERQQREFEEQRAAQQRELDAQKAELARQLDELAAAKRPQPVAAPVDSENGEEKYPRNAAAEAMRDNPPPSDVYTEQGHTQDYLPAHIGEDASGAQVAIELSPNASEETRTFFDVAEQPDASVTSIRRGGFVSHVRADQPHQQTQNAQAARTLDLIDAYAPGAPAEEMVKIPKERYEALLGDEKVLKALFAAGVDTWEGYADAMAEEVA